MDDEGGGNKFTCSGKGCSGLECVVARELPDIVIKIMHACNSAYA